MEPALLTRSGSTALRLPSARLRNLFRSELRSNGTSNSARRRLRDRICSESRRTSLIEFDLLTRKSNLSRILRRNLSSSFPGRFRSLTSQLVQGLRIISAEETRGRESFLISFDATKPRLVWRPARKFKNQVLC